MVTNQRSTCLLFLLIFAQTIPLKQGQLFYFTQYKGPHTPDSLRQKPVSQLTRKKRTNLTGAERKR